MLAFENVNGLEMGRYGNYRDISAISILSTSYCIGVFNIGFCDTSYRIVSVTNEISVIF